MTASHPSVMIVGAGFGGVAAAIELLDNGFTEVTILEAGPEPGGTWHYNDYPGAGCDVPSHFYSFSYAQRSDWTRFCSPQEEILGYLRDTASAYGVDKLIVCDRRVISCAWDDVQLRWRLTSEDSAGVITDYVCDVLVLATGQLNQPAIPSFPGEKFVGETFHSARWNHDYDLRDKRVAVIGTGASAVQFVPEIVPLVASLTVYQRTGNWFLPRQNKPYRRWLSALFKRRPGVRALYRKALYYYLECLTAAIRHPKTLGRIGTAWSAWFMRRQVPDPALRVKIWPDYAFGCKRVLFSSTFLAALGRPNVELVTESIAEQTPTGLRTRDGVQREFDAIIYSTGFKAGEFMFPMEITGRSGVSLRDAWAHGPRAHLGICVPGFPSLFVMYGPNTNTSGGSIIFFLEAQARYLRQAIALGAANAAAVDLRPEVEADSDRSLQRGFVGTAWTRCDSWYQNEAGRVVANWPRYMRDYAAATRAPDPAEFSLIV